MRKATILLVLIIICVLSITLYNAYTRDSTAVYRGETLTWKGINYVPASGAYKEGETITQTGDGGWDINEVIGDEARNFVVIRSFLDQYLLVREDYEIPKSGAVTSVHLDYSREIIEESSFCNIMQEITAPTTTEDSFQFKTTDNIRHYTTMLHFSYEKCPVGVFAGYIGFIENKWVYIRPGAIKVLDNENGSSKEETAICKIIDEKYIPIIEKYF